MKRNSDKPKPNIGLQNILEHMRERDTDAEWEEPSF